MKSLRIVYLMDGSEENDFKQYFNLGYVDNDSPKLYNNYYNSLEKIMDKIKQAYKSNIGESVKKYFAIQELLKHKCTEVHTIDCSYVGELDDIYFTYFQAPLIDNDKIKNGQKYYVIFYNYNSLDLGMLENITFLCAFENKENAYELYNKWYYELRKIKDTIEYDSNLTDEFKNKLIQEHSCPLVKDLEYYHDWEYYAYFNILEVEMLNKEQI